jgi:choline dehydrogenase-like flavoprotein
VPRLVGWRDPGDAIACSHAGVLRRHDRPARARLFRDGSHPDNRVISNRGGRPVLDYELARIKPARDEHEACIHDFERGLLHAGFAGSSRWTGLAGTAHAVGSLVTGSDPSASVVNPHGRVHGMRGLYIGDGSVLPRTSRVNPALTIYAWGLRLGEHLAEQMA